VRKRERETDRDRKGKREVEKRESFIMRNCLHFKEKERARVRERERERCICRWRRKVQIIDRRIGEKTKKVKKLTIKITRKKTI
jgi:hypothetical protein